MSAKRAEVRIPVTDIDRLLGLEGLQLKVWLYYKRREGVNKKAWGKTSTIAEAAKIKNTGSIRNTRAWLVKNGWLKPNGYSDSGLPMFLAVISKLQVSSTDDTQGASDRHLRMTPPVIHTLHPLSPTDDTEVPTVKERPEKNSALRSATGGKLVSSLVSSVPLLASLEDGTTSSPPQTDPESLDPVVLQQEQSQEQPQMRLDPLAVDLVSENRLMSLFGLPGGQTKDVGNAIRIAVVLRNSNRSIAWLTDLVRWAFEHKKFWAARLHPAARGWGQLAKHLEAGDIISQFNAHLEVKHKGIWMETRADRNAYLLPDSYWEEEGNPDDVEFESEEGGPDDVAPPEPDGFSPEYFCPECMYEDGNHHKSCKLKMAAGA